ncbi:response regulator FixJ [Sphingomonas sp. LY160]|uniref:response regulator FixJ n=1 Tax=Sphingomonas sp. LY160 TaxID=3095342 RepID=UPI002ADEAB44|nr:response regulator FixJ [Sphingomonas sp. LY160]MEA1073315.1 response regulator FixJ [Sphingomonas sp. LY160]
MTQGPVVYVIDDDKAARHSLKFLIECAGHAVRDFESATAFLATLGDGGLPAPGCIVTDVRMPEMTGVELVDELDRRKIPDPVIVITGHADVPMAIQAMKSGVSDFIEKPFADDIILSAIDAALAKRTASVDAQEERRGIQCRIDALSGREREVLDALVDGKPNKIIAFDLGISARTVEVYRANVMSKMQVKSLSELVRLALAAGEANL